MNKLIVGLLVCLLLPAGSALAETATEIVRKSDLKMRGESGYTEMTMKIIRPNWTRNMSMQSWTKGTKYAMVLVTAMMHGTTG